MNRLLSLFLLVFFVIGIFGCGDGNFTPREPVFKNMGPFKYRFSECQEVMIKTNGQVYTVRQNDSYDGDRFNKVYPFVYEFEDDGDLDIRINGRDFDLDSPCDIDFDPWKKTRKKVYNRSGYNRSREHTTIINQTIVQEKPKEKPKKFSSTKPVSAPLKSVVKPGGTSLTKSVTKSKQISSGKSLSKKKSNTTTKKKY